MKDCKKDISWIAGLAAMLLTLAIAFSTSIGTTKAENPAPVPVECVYRPGVANQIEYDYIRIDGQRYIVFRDKYSGSISVQKFF